MTTTKNDPNFKPANETIVQLEGHCWPLELFVPTAECIAWDRPADGTNRAAWLERFGCFSYLQLEVTGRVRRTFKGGVTGLKCRVRYTNPDMLPEDQRWIDAVLVEGEGVTR
jgi:hypothetical protein